MKTNKKGFTLIELLVVVLIVGILAAVALPQYRKVIEKSKISQIYELLSSINKAQQLYFINNNAYAQDLDLLDIDLPFTDPGGNFNALTYYWQKWGSKDGIAVLKKYQGGEYSLQLDYSHQQFTCCGTEGLPISLCSELGYTKWYGDAGLWKCYKRP